jgi:acetyl-CoA carboxylase carboxyltransferase component
MPATHTPAVICHCRAWREGFTITLVSGRTVGIGAYLARLGRRCVQRTDQPIILTGYSALNKVLGRQVRPLAGSKRSFAAQWWGGGRL